MRAGEWDGCHPLISLKIPLAAGVGTTTTAVTCQLALPRSAAAVSSQRTGYLAVGRQDRLCPL